MIQLKPIIDVKAACPHCGNVIKPIKWNLTGMHNLYTGICNNCNKEITQELPVNMGLFYPAILDSKTGDRIDKLPIANWFFSGLQKAYLNQNNDDVVIKVEKLKPFSKEKVAILNTLDHCYGHGLYILFNASYYLSRNDIDLIVIVPPPLRWLVPDGVSQVWTVDIPYSKLGGWYNNLNKQIHELTQGIESLYLCKAFVQNDSSEFDIYDYTRIKPFPLELWDEKLSALKITFIWKNDRFWKPVLPKIIDHPRVIKIFPFINNVRKKLQLRWIIKFLEALKNEIPNAEVALAGMDDREIKIPGWIKDFRYPIHSDETAREMCHRYAESHLVIGGTGSSLMLPCCLAGAMILISPDDMWAASAGTFPYRVTSLGDVHFRYPMLPCEVTKKRLLSTAVSILRDRSLILLHTTNPWKDHEAKIDNFAWSSFRANAIQTYKHFKSLSGLNSKPRIF
jgi:hypothetical protein